MADTGFKLSVEGEKEFRKAISDINAILRLNQAELQKVTAEYNASEKGMDAMNAKQKELGQVIERQTEAVSQMESELAQLTETYGENDKGVIKMRTELEKASASLVNMQAQFKANAEEIERANANSNAYGMTMEEVDAQIAAFSAELKAMDAVMAGGADTMRIFSRDTEETEKRIAELRKENELISSSIDEHKKKIDLLNTEMEKAVKLYGSQSKEVAEYRVQIAQTSAEVDGLTRKMDDNTVAIGKAETGAIDLRDVFGQISDMAGVKIPEGLGEVLGGVDLTTAAVTGGLIPALVSAATKVNEMVKGLRESGSEIVNLTWETGLDSEMIQLITELGDYYGVGADVLKDSMKDLRNNMNDAASGSEELANKFAELGVKIFDSNGELRNVLDVYMDLSQAFSEISDKELRLAKMEDLLGESANQSARIAAAGKAELLRVIDKIYKADLIYSNESIAQLDAQEEKWREFGLTVEGISKKIQNTFNEMNDDSWAAVILGRITGWGTIARIVNGWLDASSKTVPYYGYDMGVHSAVTESVYGAHQYPVGEQSAGTHNTWNITIPASDIKEFNDIVRIAQSKRVTERMK